MSSPSAAKAAKAALVTVCRSLWGEPVEVFYGPVGAFEADDYAEILDVSFDEGAPRLGSQRRRGSGELLLRMARAEERGGEDHPGEQTRWITGAVCHSKQQL